MQERRRYLRLFSQDKRKKISKMLEPRGHNICTIIETMHTMLQWGVVSSYAESHSRSAQIRLFGLLFLHIVLDLVLEAECLFSIQFDQSNPSIPHSPGRCRPFSSA